MRAGILIAKFLGSCWCPLISRFERGLHGSAEGSVHTRSCSSIPQQASQGRAQPREGEGQMLSPRSGLWHGQQPPARAAGLACGGSPNWTKATMSAPLEGRGEAFSPFQTLRGALLSKARTEDGAHLHCWMFLWRILQLHREMVLEESQHDGGHGQEGSCPKLPVKPRRGTSPSLFPEEFWDSLYGHFVTLLWLTLHLAAPRPHCHQVWWEDSEDPAPVGQEWGGGVGGSHNSCRGDVSPDSLVASSVSTRHLSAVYLLTTDLEPGIEFPPAPSSQWCHKNGSFSQCQGASRRQDTRL